MRIPSKQAQSKPPVAYHRFRLHAPRVTLQSHSCKWRQHANKQDTSSTAPFDADIDAPNETRQSLLNPRQAWTAEAIEDLLASPAFSEDPPGHKSGFVAIVGLPNAGKSTLLNALVGQKLAIVSPKAQSTRRRVLGIVSADEYQLVLVDTPGVMQSQRNPLEGRMMSYVRGSMREADVVVAIVDASKEDRQEEVLAMIQPPPPPAKTPPMLVVLNKVDRLEEEAASQLQEWWKTKCRCDTVVLASALRRTGVDAVRDWMLENIAEGPTLYPKEQVSEQPEKFFVSEIMRERVFELYDQEIPYATQVNVLDFKERKKGKDYILVELVVERDSQKGILLGRKGAALKALASSARADIEEYLERPVYMDVTVRVDKEWRKSAKKVEKFGY